MARRAADIARSLLLGQCVPTVKQNASKIRIKRLELDENLLMYFRNDEYYYCHDPDKKCKTGDIVLIQALPEKLTKLITHEVKEVVFPMGDVTDPVTGKKVAKDRYREDIDREVEMFGKLDSTFEYEKAPPRGWQDGKKDFTSKKTYTKFHVFDEEDPEDQIPRMYHHFYNNLPSSVNAHDALAEPDLAEERSEPLFPILSFPPPIPAPETSERASAARLRSPPSRSARD